MTLAPAPFKAYRDPPYSFNVISGLDLPAFEIWQVKALKDGSSIHCILPRKQMFLVVYLGVGTKYFKVHQYLDRMLHKCNYVAY